MVVPAPCLESNSRRDGPGAPGVFMNGCLDVITPCHSCSSVPCLVLFCVRSVGARQACPGTSGSPRLALSAVTGAAGPGLRPQ